LTIFLIAALLVLGPSNGPLKQAHSFGAPRPVSSTCQFNAIQTATIVGSPTGGTWQLSLDSVLTPSLSVTATARDVFSALSDPRARLPITPGDVEVTGPNGGPYTITFSGAMSHSVDRLRSVNSFTGRNTPKVHIGITPIDQTDQFQELVNSSPDKSTLTLPHDSCWEIDGNLPAGKLNSNLFVDDPAGMATLSNGLVFGGTLTTKIKLNEIVTRLHVTNTGTQDIPDASSVALTTPLGGRMQTFTTSGDTRPGSTTVKISGHPTATADFRSRSQFAGFVTSVAFSPASSIDVPSGSHLYVSNPSMNHDQTFVTNTDTPPGSTSFGVYGQAANFHYSTRALALPIPQTTTITTDGSNQYDIPSGSQVGVTDGGDDNNDNNQDFTTVGDTPPGRTTITVHPVIPNFPYVAGSQLLVENNLHIHDNTNLTINGNGATLVQTQCQPDEFNSVNPNPVIFLTQDTNLTIENLSIFGAFGWPGANCNVNGQSYQKSGGIIMEAETNLTLTNIHIYNTQGDLVDVQIPVNFGITGNPLNTNIVIANSTFDAGGGGFHGLGVESVGPTPSCPDCGLTISNTSWLHTGSEWADFEVDNGSTQFTGTTGCTSLPGGLCPTFAAQDNVRILHNSMTNWCDEWLASGQGFGMGVQEQNWLVSGNTLTQQGCFFGGGGFGSFMHINVHPTAGDPPQYWTGNWLITHNTVIGTFGSVASAGCAGGTTGEAMQLGSTVGITIEDNVFPVRYLLCGTPYLQFFGNAQPSGAPNTNLTIRNNQFPGASRVAGNTVSGLNPGYSQCGNSWGEAGTSTPPTKDPACA
jgi:hypothetical protein